MPAKSSLAEAPATEEPGAEKHVSAADHAPPQWLKPSRLLPLLAARISTALGLKLELAPGDYAAPSSWLTLGEFRGGQERLWLAMPGRDAMALMDCAMGGNGDVPETLTDTMLEPGSASWGMLAAQLTFALQPLLAEQCRCPVVGEPSFIADVAQPAGFSLPLTLSHGPSGFRLLLAGSRPVLPATAGPNEQRQPDSQAQAIQRWQDDAHSICMDLPVPIAAQLSVQRMALGELLELRVGDSIALPPVKALRMIVSGQEHGRLPLGGAVRPLINGEWS